jgi:hypothetical protein
MVFLCTVTDLTLTTELELSNINNCICHEPDDTVSYCHDASDQAHLSADRGNLTESQQFTALVAESTDEAKEDDAFKTARFQVKIVEMDRRHVDEMAAIARLNTRALDVLAAMGGEEKGDEKQSSRSLRKRKGQDTTAEESTISPPNQKKSRN